MSLSYIKMSFLFNLILLSIISFISNKTFLFTDWSIINYYKLLLEHSTSLTNFINMFSTLIIFITSMILTYSISYISKNNILSYFMLMMLFALSMLVFIMSTNIFSVMLGWDGLGLTSFLLVFFFSSKSNISPSVMTVLMNRVGDVCLIMSILLMKGSFHSFQDFMMGSSKMFWILIMLMALTKSAQLPFSAWLPAAMAAPTPTSALVHSSTLVTAGAFLLAHSSNMMNMEQKSVMAMVAGMTLLMSSLATLSNWDIKKIIALSTLSQMSILFLMLMVLDAKILMNHLLNHAVFKALLFMSAGWVIYQESDKQEVRSISMKSISNPFILSSYFISLFSLMGMPFSASHYSKHYFVIYLSKMYFNYWIFFSTTAMLMMTLVYSIKICSLTNFMSKMKTFKSMSYFKKLKYSSKSLKQMTYCSIISGLMLNYLLIEEIKMYLETMMFKYLYMYIMMDMTYMTYCLMLNNKPIWSHYNMKYQQFMTFIMVCMMTYFMKKMEYMENVWMLNQKMNMFKKKNFFFSLYFSIKVFMVYMIITWSVVML